MHKVRVKFSPSVGSGKKLTDPAVPIQDTINARKLIFFLEFLNRRFEHPQLAMVVDEDLFSEAIIPQAKHHLHHNFSGQLFFQHDGSRHAQMMIGMRPVIVGGKCQSAWSPAFCRIPADPFQNLGHHKGIKP